ncbi:MAG: PEP-CTERM sorting domain-containing protein [bacterium]|nr:PEP-CTERM sorting domain-containing protein [bacterium]
MLYLRGFFASLSAAACVLVFAGSAYAALVDNGSTTVDTDTNLEWLDLTETLGLSYADALASSFVTVDGYRSATSLEVAELFTNAGMSEQDNLAREVDFAAAADLLNLLGCTLAPAVCATTANPIGTGYAEWTPGTGRRALYRTDSINGGRGAATVESSFLTTANPEIGTYLVRIVPEPSTGLLLLGGLAALSRTRRDATRA